jgi:uncharacterized protein (DUF433 family)
MKAVAASPSWVYNVLTGTRRLHNFPRGLVPFRSAGPIVQEGAMNREQVISVDPEVMGGTPVFAGTRVPVASLIAHLKAGDTLEDFLDGFPSVRREQAEAFLDFALQAALGDHARAA